MNIKGRTLVQVNGISVNNTVLFCGRQMRIESITHHTCLLVDDDELVEPVVLHLSDLNKNQIIKGK